MFKKFCFMMSLLVTCGTAYAAAEGDLAIGTTKAGVTVTLDRIITEGKSARQRRRLPPSSRCSALGPRISP